METLADEAEESTHHGKMQALHNTIKNLSGKFSKPVKDSDGKAIEEG